MLVQQIRDEMKEAMRAKDSLRLEAFRMTLAAFTNELVAKGLKPTEVLDDAGAVAVIKRLVKQRKDSAEQFTAGGRPELAEKELAEVKVLEVFLPQTASREAILKVAQTKKAELGITDAAGTGKLMGVVIKEFAGNADGADVKEVVASLFS